MKNLFIIFHESKYGTDYEVRENLADAIDQANALTKEHYSDHATHYKDVKREGYYGDIYIKSLPVSLELSSSELERVLNLITVNPHTLKTEDNEIFMTKYSALSKFLNKHNFILSQAQENYAKVWAVVDPKNNQVVKLSSQYLISGDLCSFSYAVNTAPDTHMRAVAKKIEYDRDVNMDLSVLDQWILKWIDLPYQMKEIKTKEETFTLLYT